MLKECGTFDAQRVVVMHSVCITPPARVVSEDRAEHRDRAGVVTCNVWNSKRLPPTITSPPPATTFADMLFSGLCEYIQRTVGVGKILRGSQVHAKPNTRSSGCCTKLYAVKACRIVCNTHPERHQPLAEWMMFDADLWDSDGLSSAKLFRYLLCTYMCI